MFGVGDFELIKIMRTRLVIILILILVVILIVIIILIVSFSCMFLFGKFDIGMINPFHSGRLLIVGDDAAFQE